MLRPSPATGSQSQQRFVRDVRRALDAIARAPEGTRVVTYHGLGATLAPDYRLVSVEEAGTDVLELWVKRAAVANAADE